MHDAMFLTLKIGYETDAIKWRIKYELDKMKKENGVWWCNLAEMDNQVQPTINNTHPRYNISFMFLFFF